MGNFNQMHEGGGGRGWADNAWSKQFLNCFSLNPHQSGTQPTLKEWLVGILITTDVGLLQ